MSRNYGPDDLAVFGVIQVLLLERINLTINSFLVEYRALVPLEQALMFKFRERTY